MTAFATSAEPNRSYQLVTATAGDAYACSVDPVVVNSTIRLSNARGFIPVTTGPVNRPPGTYQLCFSEVGTGPELHHISLPVLFAVS